MLERIEALELPHGREQSFKLSPGRLLADRLLLGVQRRHLTRQALLDLARDLGMPAPAQQLVTARFEEANAVFFATEDDGADRMFKVYLEFWDAVRSRVRAGDVSPQLLHLGVKWGSARPGHHEEAHYTCEPLLGVRDVLRRMRSVYPASAPDTALRIAQQIVRLGVLRRADAAFLYLEAGESGNPRRSFDVNLYKTGLLVADAARPLRSAAAYFGVDEARFERELATMGPLPLGHVAGGCDRRGSEFLSVYAEIAPLPEPGDQGWSER